MARQVKYVVINETLRSEIDILNELSDDAKMIVTYYQGQPILDVDLLDEPAFSEFKAILKDLPILTRTLWEPL